MEHSKSPNRELNESGQTLSRILRSFSLILLSASLVDFSPTDSHADSFPAIPEAFPSADALLPVPTRLVVPAIPFHWKVPSSSCSEPCSEPLMKLFELFEKLLSS